MKGRLLGAATALVALALTGATAHAAPPAAPVTPTVGVTVASLPVGGINDVAVDGNGNIYVVNEQLHDVRRWAPGAPVDVTGSVIVAGNDAPGFGPAQLQNPTGVAVDRKGNVYVADGANFHVQRWARGATQGVTVAGGHGAGVAADQLYLPSGVAVDAKGNLYVADSGNGLVQRWAPGATQGVTVAGGNGRGDAPDQLALPVAVAFDSRGNLYVADWANGRVQKFLIDQDRGRDGNHD